MTEPEHKDKDGRVKQGSVAWFAQALRFGLIGGLGAAINLALYLGLVKLHVHYVIASCVGWLTALVVVFLLNRTYTFGSDQPLLESFAKTFSVYLAQQA